MWPDRVSNPGPLTYEPGALPTALRGPALSITEKRVECQYFIKVFEQLCEVVGKLCFATDLVGQ